MCVWGEVMKVVDCTIWNQPFEATLFWLKVVLESPLVDEFVVSECTHTYRGAYKGATAVRTITADSRLDPYRDRITVLTADYNLSGTTPEAIDGQIDPPQCDQAERLLRELPTRYVLDKYGDEDRVFTSDVDEAFDCQDPARRDRLWKLLQDPSPKQVERIRFSYSPDIRSWRDNGDIVNPIYSVGDLRAGRVRLSQKKWVGELIPHGDDPLCFEWCCLFPDRAYVHSKFDSSLHTQWHPQLIEDSLDACHWTMTAYQGKPDPRNRWHWFERVRLTEKNSPAFVRENLDRLRTGLVPDDYRARRLALYGFSHHPANEGQL